MAGGLHWSEDDLADLQRRGIRVLDGRAQARPLQPPGVHHQSDREAPAAGGGAVEVTPRTKRKRRNRPEQKLQIAAVELLTAALPADWRVIHVPNGGWRSKIEAGIMKAMGVSAGFPDLAILRPKVSGFCGGLALVIEFKAKGRRGKGLSEDQEDWRDWFLRQGIAWALCRSIEDVIAACQDAGIPIRARAA